MASASTVCCPAPCARFRRPWPRGSSPKVMLNQRCGATPPMRRMDSPASKSPGRLLWIAGVVARPTADQPFILITCIDVGERAFVRNLEIALDRRMRADDRLRAGADVGGTQLAEQRAIDQQRMTVASAARRPDDRGVGLPVSLDDGPHCGRGYEGHVDERQQRRRDTWTID